MPYIGQIPAIGENNSFKVLDDITSYTLTFNGSSASLVSVANDTITNNSHRFITGQRVTYNTTGTTITGLTAATAYFIIKEDQNTVKLATTYANAINNIAINFTALGTGSTHTLNIAFDGVNTKFKATYDNGTKAQITRAAQLTLSVNGVIQQPQDTASPTTGFGIDFDSVIVFSTAPISTDVFWGNLVANNFPTFDIADNTVDSFTGDGTTTSFTLSKEPANNQNLLVTLDGVVQYPSDAFVTRAYNVISNVITFQGAPGNATAIQVRHIGFAGATSSAVTGFYGRTGNVGLTTADTVSIGAATIGTGGIGTSLLVQGNARITGILTIGTGSITIDGVNNTITGAININATGISTVGSLSIGVTSVISSARQLQNIASLDATTTATIESAITNAPNTFTNLNITGISTLGVTSATNLIAQSLNVSGISTFTAGPVFIGSGTSTGTASQPLQVTGGAYVSGYFGIGSTNPQRKLDVSGDATTIDNNATIRVLTTNTTGYGAALTLNATSITSGRSYILKSSGNSDSAGVGKFAINDASANIDRLVIDSSGNLGIGTTNPSQKVHIFQSATSSQAYLHIENNRSRNAAVQFTTTQGFWIIGQGIGSDTDTFMIYDDEARLSVSGTGSRDVTINTGNLVIGTSGKGIDFSATANSSGTMTSELLADYEEGTFTPSLTFGGGSTGIIHSIQSGNYVKIGTMVFVRVGVLITNKGSSTGVARITGLPFTIKTLSYGDATGACGYGGMTGLTGSLCLSGENNNNIIYILQGATTSALTISDSVFTNGAYIFGTLCYNVA